MPKSIDAHSYYQATAHLPLASEPQGRSYGRCLRHRRWLYGPFGGARACGSRLQGRCARGGTVGYGASGRNGGQICTGFSSGQQKIEAQLGKDDALKCFAIAEEAKSSSSSHQAVQDRLRSHMGLPARHPEAHHFDELKAWRDEWDELGYRRAVLTKTELEEQARHPDLSWRIARRRRGAFSSAELLPWPGRAAIKRGARSTKTRASSRSIPASDPGRARSKERSRPNSWSSAAMPISGARCSPLWPGHAGHELHHRHRTLGENRAKSLIRDDEAVANTNFIVDYFRLTG